MAEHMPGFGDPFRLTIDVFDGALASLGKSLRRQSGEEHDHRAWVEGRDG